MTVRDSAHDFINVACWGSLDYINNLSYDFTIGSYGKNYKFVNCQDISNNFSIQLRFPIQLFR